MYDNIAVDLPGTRDRDIWPRSTWFHLSLGGSRFVVNHPDPTGRTKSGSGLDNPSTLQSRQIQTQLGGSAIGVTFGINCVR